VILAFSKVSQNCFCIGKVLHRVYGSRDHGGLLFHGILTTMGRCGRSRAREFVVIARRERERGSHQWCHLDAKLQGWSHDSTQHRRRVVPRWGAGFGPKEERLELGWAQWILGVLSLRLL
jgi:hypothetical protein